jgi:hypothetical protein
MRDPMMPPTMATTARSAAAPPFRRGAPNVLVIVFDDLGFAHLGSYGSALATPNGQLTWCIAGKGGAHFVRAPAPTTTRVLVAEGTLIDGRLEVTLTADDTEIARRSLEVHPPLAWAPDGAFLTIGYARPFPVNDDYTPPAAASASLVDISIHVGPLPPFDPTAELERILRHQ